MAGADTTRCTHSISPCVNGTAASSQKAPYHTPYTRPCKRDISAKLTPAGVGACTHTARSKKPSYHPPCGYIYIYTHTHIDTVATNRYLTVTSLDIFRPLPTHFHPVFSVVCPPEFALVFPGYFRFPTFPPFRYPRLDPFSISMPPRVFRLPFHTRGHLIAFEKFNFDDSHD